MKEFMKLAFEKFVENLLSIKVWTIFILMFVGAYLVWHDKMSGEVYAGLMGGVISTVYALREAFKVQKVKSLNDTDEIKKIKV